MGPVPGVDVMAKRSQGLLNVGGSFPRTLGCFRAHLREQRARGGGGRGAAFARRLQGDALGGPGPAWVQLGPPLARGAPAGELTAANSTTGTSKRGLALYFKGARWAVPGSAFARCQLHHQRRCPATGKARTGRPTAPLVHGAGADATPGRSQRQYSVGRYL